MGQGNAGKCGVRATRRLGAFGELAAEEPVALQAQGPDGGAGFGDHASAARPRRGRAHRAAQDAPAEEVAPGDASCRAVSGLHGVGILSAMHARKLT